MSASSSGIALTGLARALVQAERLSLEDAEAIARQAPSAELFIEPLIASGRFSARALAEFASQTFGFPLLDLDALEVADLPLSLIDRKLIQTRKILPLKMRGNRLSVAVSDPSSSQTLNEAKFQTGLTLDPVVVEDDKLRILINRLLAASDATLRSYVNDDLTVELSAVEMQAADDPSSTEADDTPVVRFIQKVLTDAIAEGASDVHFEPYEKFYRIRTRTDGVLREVIQPPVLLKERIAARLKVISKMDISEKRVPQDGRFKLASAGNRGIEFRVSSLPTLHGEKVVLRILDSSTTLLGIDSLGYEPEEKKRVIDAIKRPYGMILVTGPTGSGKTVSLYTFLNMLNKPGVNISTAEDPTEMNLPGINQVNVNDRAGLSFATALRSFLRQDPDIIMLGEIRDLETAEIAVKAAQTGHLVLSTLHTNDAPASLIRLANMGVPGFNIASSVILITAQRLARRLCGCKAAVHIPEHALLEAGYSPLDLDGSWTALGPVGCERCKDSGYRGRVGLFQVLPISDEMNRLIMQGANTIEIAELAAREGVKTLRQAGLLKVKQGVTSLEEVMGCTNE